MGARRRGRELALQALYRAELTGDDSPEALAVLWEHIQAGLDARTFARDLFVGVVGERGRLDELVAEVLEHWGLARLSRVDRNILRIAVYELLHGADMPVNVILNEALEIARRFGSEESVRFVNGILDKVAHNLGLPHSGGTEPPTAATGGGT